MAGKLFIISGPSGSGKTTILQELLKQPRLNNLERVVTYTTRPMRQHEISGVDYHFMPHDLFEKRINEGFFLEWSTAYGNYYGSPVSIKDSLYKGRSSIMILDRIGAQAIKYQIPEALLIWIEPPSLEQLKERLVHRNANSLAEIERRLELAREEMAYQKKEPLYNHYVVNDQLKQTVQHLEDFIFKQLQLSK